MKIRKINRYGVFFFALFLLCLAIFSARVIITNEAVGSDGIHYFIMTRSFIMDGDINLTDEYEHYSNTVAYWSKGMILMPPENVPRTKTGHIGSVMAIGTEIMWIPFFVLGHLMTLFLNIIGLGIPTDGYSLPYTVMVSVSSIAASVLGLYFLFKFMNKFFKKDVSLLATMAIFFASPAFFYTALQPSMSHSVSMAAVIFFVYFWHRTLGNRTTLEWIYLGMIAGFMCLVRWQDSLFIAVLLYDFVSDIRKKISLKKIFGYLTFFVFLVITFIPQMVVWKIHHGSFLTIPQGNGFLTWTTPHITEVLFSTNNGLFYWAPLLMISFFAGFYFFFKKNRTLSVMLFLTFLFEIYINSTVSDWNGGTSFAGRRFMCCIVFFAFCLASVIETFHKRIKLIAVTLSILVLWNLNITLQSVLGMLALGTNVPFSEFLSNTWLLIAKIFKLV
jgi:hypothetical protein